MKTLYFICLLNVSLFLGCTGPQGPAGPSAIDEMTNPNIKPKVIWTFPSNGQVGPIRNWYNRIQIRFNKLLDITTINQSIQSSPLQDGLPIIDTIYVRVPNGDNIDIPIYSYFPWKIGQAYTITILTTLRDIHGNNLQSPYSFSFTPEPYLRLTYISPRDGSTGISRYTDIELNFNSRLNSMMDTVVTFSPPISGSWLFQDGRASAFFNTSTQLNANTTYVVTVSTRTVDRDGNRLPSPFTFSFTTGE